MMEPVQEILEGMVPELEDYQDRKLFNATEIRAIVKKRTAIEYNVRRHTSSESDYTGAIAYEKALDRLRKIRKKRKGDEKNDGASDRACITRQHHIYQRLLRKYPAKTEFWLEYIKFARKSGSGKATSRAFGRLLSLQPTDPQIWVHAAAWEFESNGNVDAARALLQKALQTNPRSDALWLCLFKMELKYTKKLQARHGILLGHKRKLADAKEEENEENEELQLQRKFLIELPLPRAIFENAMKANEGRHSLALLMLNAVPKKRAYSHLLKAIYSHLEQFSSSTAVLPVLAKHAVSDAARAQNDTYSSAAESAGIAVFDKALKESGTPEMYQCYALYLQARLKAQGDRHKDPAAVGLLTEALFGVYDSANAEDLLNCEMFGEWIALLQHIGEDEEASRVAAAWTTHSPRHVPAWATRIRLSPSSFTGADGGDRCSAALEAVNDPKSQAELLAVLMEVRVKVGAEGGADQLQTMHTQFEEAITRCMTLGAQSDRVEIQYIRWCALRDTDSLSRAMDFVLKCQRLTLAALQEFLPRYRDHTGFADWKSAEYLRGVFRRASRTLGKRSPQFWIHYVEFEKEVDMTKVPTVRKQALKKLQRTQVDDFLLLYSKLSGIT